MPQTCGKGSSPNFASNIKRSLAKMTSIDLEIRKPFLVISGQIEVNEFA